MITYTPQSPVLSPQSLALTLDHLTRLAKFQIGADVGLFVEIFGHEAGPYWWNKFEAYDENLLFVTDQMDSRTVQKLLNYLNR